MNARSKLKETPLPTLLGISGGLLALIILIYVTRQMDKQTADRVIGVYWVFVSLIQLIVWLRTRNPGYLIWMLTCLAIAVSYLSTYKGIYVFIPAVLFITANLYFLIKGRMRWRYRDILELAAQPVQETGDGFTARPYPAGTAPCSKEELIRFGKYLSKNLIAFPTMDEERIYLAIKGTTGLLFRKPTVQKNTFVSFDYEGNIAVNIAKKDYKKYKDELSFDQLCASMGSIFKEFLELYQNGNKELIIPLINEHIIRLQNNAAGNHKSSSVKKYSKVYGDKHPSGRKF
jgi:hypothetical protein